MKNKKGFTLVELLAVIVILAVILVIAVPQVMNIIEDVRKASFSSSVKLLASEAEKKFVQNEVLGKDNNISCESISKLNKEDYEYCNITMDNGIALVTLVGKNKFEGMKVLNGTKTNADVTEDNGEELYTLEDVYRMVNSLTSQLETVKSEKAELEEEISALKKTTNKNREDIIELKDTTSNMSMLKAYPVGSIYMSENSTSPEELFGGEWTQLKDRFLLGAGDTYEAGSTGGSKTHQHKYGLQFGGYWKNFVFVSEANAGLLNYSSADDYTLLNASQSTTYDLTLNKNWEYNAEFVERNTYFYKIIANTSSSSTLPPYLTVYMWKRTA